MGLAKYTVIADISQSIVDMLKDNIVPEPVSKSSDIGICDPADMGDYIVGIYPYNIEENKEVLINKPIDLPDGSLKEPPTSYKIYYMISIESRGKVANKASDEQKILGRILQLFKDTRVLPQEYMTDSLRDFNETINIDIISLDLEEKSKIWSMFNKPYRLSVFFSLEPVLIESKKVRVPAKRVETVEFKSNYKR